MRATASYHKLSAGCTPGGGQLPFPPSSSGAKMFDNILQSAW